MTDSRPYVLLGDRGVLAVAGVDRVAFLQGLVSNDVAKATRTRALYAALLTAQGKYLHDFFMVAEGDTLLIEGEAARLDDLRRRLTLYKLRSKVTIADASDRLVAVALPGAEAARALELGQEPGTARSFARGIAYVDPRLAALGVRLLLPRDDAASLLTAHGFTPAGADLYDRLRLTLGVPDGSRDMTIEKAILLEAGFDELNGVDWNKGCYIGQELTARTKYRALIKKRLMPVTIDGPLPLPGAIVQLGEAEAGEMRSGRDGLGLALLRLEAVAEAAQRGTPLTAGAARLTPVKPDWMRI